MRIPLPLWPPADATPETSSPPSTTTPLDLPVVRVFLGALGVILLGYMFMGRGFAHLGLPPLHVGEVVLALGLTATAVVLLRLGFDVRRWRLEWLLLAFMVLGATRTLPYVPQYGWDAMRDGTLWGYGLFALTISLLGSRVVALRSLAAMAVVVPVFAMWLPISWNLFAAASASIDPNRPGEVVPLVFFKGGDMAVHVAAACAVLVLGTAPYRSLGEFLARIVIGVPLLWTAFVAGTSNRGALVTFIAGIVLLGALAGRRRNWLPLGAALVLLVGGLAAQAVLDAGAQPTPGPTASGDPLPTTARPSTSSWPGSSSGSSPDATRRPRASASDDPGGAATLPPIGGESVSIANPGFEAGEVNSGRIQGWTVSGVGTFNIVSDDARSGGRSAVLAGGGNPYETWVKSSTFPFEPDDDVFVALWARAIDGRPHVEIYVNWLGADRRLIESAFLGSMSPNGSGRWHLLAGALTAPGGTELGQVQIYQARDDAVLGLDEITVRSGDFITVPPPPRGRPAQFDQFIENILSIFTVSSDRNLEGTKQFRLAWWGAIIDYTVFGEHFWTGKGFGVNLADADGFQSTADRSLRAPHNSHLTVLARMGVPGLAVWVVLQGAFAVGMIRAVIILRRIGDPALAAVAAGLLVYWFAMMIDTSFDPYLEGPQGGIWFWSVFGMGLVVMRLARRGVEA